jgi:hypothetical protein
MSRAAPVAAPARSLNFYAEPGALTSPGSHQARLAELPSDVTGLARAIQGLVLHEFLAGAYGVKVHDERRVDTHIRPFERMLDALLAQDARPLSVARPLDKRLLGVCRHFVVFVVGALRAHGVSARGRRGFGSYFEPGLFTDHEVAEVWTPSESRWVRVDSQLDDVQRRLLGVDFDPLDVPSNRFLTAADAWIQCRSGVDASKFGIHDTRGLWFVASNLIRDAAWLNKWELLPWDVWGAMPTPEWTPDDAQLAFFDRLAELTSAPDAAFEELRALYEDYRLRVPAVVFNAMLRREERVTA